MITALPPRRASSADRGRSPAELREIAVCQKAVLAAVLLNLIAYPALALPHNLGVVIGMIVLIYQIIVMYRLARALALPVIWLWMAGALMPCVSFLLLYAMNGLATNALQAAGVHVGLFGGRMRDFDGLE